jgi:glycosyltransferase involved in cell wall biosynthesis
VRKKVLFVQQTLQPPGGASAVAAWILEALKNRYEVTVLSAGPADLPAVNRFYGTSLRDSDFRVIYPNRLIRAFLGLDFDAGSIQPAAYLMRMCRRIRHHYDLVVAAGMEEMDLGGPGLLYLHYPHLARFWQNHVDGRAGLRGLLRGRTRPWMLLAGYSVDRMKQNTMLANSEWTGDRIEEAYGIRARTVYPPVVDCPRQLSWEDRDISFVCAGRLQARKRMDWVIATLAKVRERYPAIVLHLVGTRDEGKEAAAYYRVLRTLVQGNGEWVHLHEDLSREGLLELMGRSRYAIHALKDEHFGIAPAEAVMAGCITFVHDSGGQVEIVGRDPRLCYRDEDASAKLSAVVANEELQSTIRMSLAAKREMFAVERFMEEIRDVVSSTLV